MSLHSSYLKNSDGLIQLALKCLETRLRYHTEQFKCSNDAKAYLKLQLAEEKDEVFAVLFLNNRHQLLTFEKLFSGTVNEAVIYPRTVVRKGLEQNAAAVIVAHNHPSGESQPSNADKEVTKQLKQVLDIVNIKLLDHLIVTHKALYSFAENHLI
jgi:DNA repair protein RadC